MPSAAAVVAHHDDHILWMGGTIQRLRNQGWDWTLVAMCVPPDARQPYFNSCCQDLGCSGYSMDFADYMGGQPFCRNSKAQMEAELLKLLQGKSFDWAFTHSRYANGEYGGQHANHVEVRTVVESLVGAGQLAKGPNSIVYFSYDLIYGGGGRATVAKKDPPHEAGYFIQLQYQELLTKCQCCQQAPDLVTNLKGLGFPCPNPEGFEGDGLTLPLPFIPK